MPELGPLGKQTVGKTSEGRAIIANPDGSFSTERSATVTHPLINGGRPTNIPTIFRGQQFDGDQAAEIIAKFSNGGKITDPETGRVLEAFDTIKLAEKAAKTRSGAIKLNFFKGFGPKQNKPIASRKGLSSKESVLTRSLIRQ